VRILVLSDLFPPVAFGGYELECAALTDRLRHHHELLVLTTDLRRDTTPRQDGVLRALPFAGGDRRRAVARAPIAALRGAIVTRRVLKRFAPDLIYVSNGVSMPQAAIAIAVSAGIPVVCRFSELFYASTFLEGDRFLRHLAPGERGARGAWARGLRAVNRLPPLRIDPEIRLRAGISWASASLRDTAGRPASIDPVVEWVIHPATPRADVFTAVRRAPDARPSVAYIGRVTVAKGAEVAMRALAVAREEHGLDLRLVFAGTCAPDVRRRLDGLAGELGVTGHVEYLGHLSPEGLAAVLARASLALIPSLEHEAFSLVAVEAALAGTPVVAARVGGIPEVLRDREHALLFEPGDARTCAGAMAAVLASPAEADARAERARVRAAEFGLDVYLDRSEELIAHVV